MAPAAPGSRCSGGQRCWTRAGDGFDVWAGISRDKEEIASEAAMTLALAGSSGAPPPPTFRPVVQQIDGPRPRALLLHASTFTRIGGDMATPNRRLFGTDGIRGTANKAPMDAD